MGSYRKERLEELIKRTVAESLLRKTKDPRIGFITVTKVKLSRGYSIADVWVSVIGDEKETKQTMIGVQSASGYIQHIVGKNIITGISSVSLQKILSCSLKGLLILTLITPWILQVLKVRILTEPSL